MRTLTINKKSYPVLFSLSAITNFCENRTTIGAENLTLPQFFEWLQSLQTKGKVPDFGLFKDLSLLTYFAVASGCRYENVEFNIDRSIIYDEVLNAEFLNTILEAIVDSLPGNSKVEKKNQLEPVE